MNNEDKKQIKINCESKDLILWKELIDIQGEVKNLSEVDTHKLLYSLEQNGFCDPFLVWINPENNEKICIAGNQRLKVLKIADKEGYEIPERLPCAYLKAKNIKDAQQSLLSLASTFGTIHINEFNNFIKNNELDMVEIISLTSFPKINIDHTLPEINTNIDKESPAKDKNNEDNQYYLKIPCSKEQAEKIYKLIYTIEDKLKTKGLIDEQKENNLYNIILYILSNFNTNN